jgi:hypothetical protein
MYVFALLALAPLALLAVMGLSWLENRLLPPPGRAAAVSSCALPAVPRGGSCPLGTALPPAWQ